MGRFCEMCGGELSPNAAFCRSCGAGGSSAFSSSGGGAAAAPQRSPVREETTLFDEAGIQVTSARLIVGGRTYAMGGITSVRSTVFTPSKVGPVLVILFGTFGVFNTMFLRAYPGVIATLAIIVLGVLWFRSKKPTYTVRVTSASGETDAFSSKDQSLVGRIVASINDAIVHRG